MSGQAKKSVDEIWKELNARSAPRGIGAAGLLNIPGVSSKSRIVSGLAHKPTASGPETSAVSAQDVALSNVQHCHKVSADYDPEKAGVTIQDVQSYVGPMQRLINCCSDPDRSTRRQAIQSLHLKLTQGDASSPKPSPQLLQALVCGPLLHPITQLLHDNVEKCRSTAIQLLIHCITMVPDFEPALPTLVPALVQRMGVLPVQEPSEELRLQLMELLAKTLGCCGKQSQDVYVTDLSTIICRAQEDNYHEIKKTGCTCLISLTSAVHLEALQPHAEKLLNSLLPNLAHPHSRVRLVVIQALDALVCPGSMPAGLVSRLVAPGVSSVIHDRAPAVREALFVALARWLGYSQPTEQHAASGGDATADVPVPNSTADRQQSQTCRLQSSRQGEDHATSLLPLLLVGVTDPQPSIAALSLQLVQGVGQLWLSETQAAAASSFGLRDDQQAADTRATASSQISPAITDMVVEHTSAPSTSASTPTTAADISMQDITDDVKSSSAIDAAVAACQLGHPYSGRPTEGCRQMVQTLLPQILPPMLKDLSEWTVAQRAVAARSCHTTLVLAESKVVDHLPALLPALCNAIGDEDPVIAGHIIACVHVVGAHVPARHWLPLIIDQLSNGKTALAHKANCLVVLSGLLHAAGRAQQTLTDDLVQSLTSALSSEELRGADHPAVCSQLLAVTTNIIRWVRDRCAPVSQQLYFSLLQLYGFERDSSKRAQVQATIGELAGFCGCMSAFELADQHADALLPIIAHDSASWSVESPGYQAFRALLQTSGADTLRRLMQDIAALLNAIFVNEEQDPNLRLNLLQLLDNVLEDPHRGPALGNEHAELLLRQVICPPLVWRAGKVAAAIRFAAITALATALRHGLLPQGAVLALVQDSTLLPLIQQCLDEDWYVDVRLAACVVMEQVLRLLGPDLTHEQRRAIYPELLKRLDDSNNGVRIAACKVIVAFADTMGAGYCDTNTGYLVAGVVIHMDDSDPLVQEAACAAMEAVAAVKPEVVAAEVSKVKERFRARHYCDRVLEACCRMQIGN